MNDFSAPGWGHIGYGVRPDERRKGYATLILKMALQKCGILGLDEVLLGCFKENIVSAEPFRTTVECPNTKSLKEKAANCCSAIGSGWTEQKVFFLIVWDEDENQPTLLNIVISPGNRMRLNDKV